MGEGKEFTILVVGNHIPHNLDESSSIYYAGRITEHIKNDITSYYQKIIHNHRLELFPITTADQDILKEVSQCLTSKWNIVTFGNPIDANLASFINKTHKDASVIQYDTKLSDKNRSSSKKTCNAILYELRSYLKENSIDSPSMIITFIDYNDKYEKKLFRKIIKLKKKYKMDLILHGTAGQTITGNLI